MQGIYLRAFEKLFNILEDSGWELKRKEDEEEEGSDEEEHLGIGRQSVNLQILCWRQLSENLFSVNT